MSINIILYFSCQVNHLMQLEDDRFRCHPTFILIVTNQYLRRQCLTAGNIVYNKATEKMTLEELQQKMAEEDPETLANLRYYGRNIEVSKSYFHYRGIENLALNEHLRYCSKDKRMLNIFHTFRHILHLHDINLNTPCVFCIISVAFKSSFLFLILVKVNLVH